MYNQSRMKKNDVMISMSKILTHDVNNIVNIPNISNIPKHNENLRNISSIQSSDKTIPLSKYIGVDYNLNKDKEVISHIDSLSCNYKNIFEEDFNENANNEIAINRIYF